MAQSKKETLSSNNSSLTDIFLNFLRLGAIAFGGPLSHLAYFQNEFVQRRQWITGESYADLVALCQFLPGPATSQVGFALGLFRGGLLGGFAAWLGFTLPSAIALIVFAYYSNTIEGKYGSTLLHGLNLAAIAVVGHALWAMARKLCPDWQRILIAILCLSISLSLHASFTSIIVISFGAAIGLIFCRNQNVAASGRLSLAPISRHLAISCLILFLVLLVLFPMLATLWPNNALNEANIFYRVGALVFGGGHVVLPLLQTEVVQRGWVDDKIFLAGYSAAQAVPGPMFAFSAYLGTAMKLPPNGMAGAIICLVSIFTPGFLLLVGALPFWDSFRQSVAAQAVMNGIKAAVVGLLASAFYSPLWQNTIFTDRDVIIGAIGLTILLATKLPPWVIVVCVTVSVLLLSPF